MAEVLLDSSTAEPLAGNNQANPPSSVNAAATVASDTAPDEKEQQQQQVESCVYRALVVDSGPIIRLTSLSSLRNSAKQYYTVPAVIQEIRDAKARQHLENLSFELITREASPEGIQAMVDFSRQTGDYRNLSAVDLQVLGLLYDLEREGCEGNMTHVRKTPKRTLGVGRIVSLAKKEDPAAQQKHWAEEDTKMEEIDDTEPTMEDGVSFFEHSPDVVAQNENLQKETDTTKQEGRNYQRGIAATSAAPNAPAPKTWAMLVNPASAAASSPPSMKQEPKVADKALHVTFGSMDLSATSTATAKAEDDEAGGQFSDAEEDDFEQDFDDDSDDDDDGYADDDKEISDEECDVYILDPEEVEERKRSAQEGEVVVENSELESDFPSLTAAMQVPYDGSDDDAHDDDAQDAHKNPAILAKEKAESRKKQALQPLTSSGKLYNSFRKYGDLLKPKEVVKEEKKMEKEEVPTAEVASPMPELSDQSERHKERHSRIMGGMTMSGQGVEVDDDGEGWVTCTKDIRKMKAAGALDPSRNPNINDDMLSNPEQVGPPLSQRAACATTDFAMQNVILQMNLELLSVDGIKVRRLKSWVTRCGACFTVYADGADSTGPQNMKRLFCARCGSDYLQRVAASVDGKTGRLRLHLSKKYKNNLRGTKYSLPKAGRGNRYQGDLLLREDQLMTGAWNQKVRKQTGRKGKGSAQSIFGSDVASSVGCHADMRDDIKVGFGRRNPNASNHGRERRGKKKKTSDKACGLRRY